MPSAMGCHTLEKEKVWLDHIFPSEGKSTINFVLAGLLSSQVEAEDLSLLLLQARATRPPIVMQHKLP